MSDEASLSDGIDTTLNRISHLEREVEDLYSRLSTLDEDHARLEIRFAKLNTKVPADE